MRPKRFKKFTPIAVYWEDIVSETKWNTPSDIDKAKTASVITLGFFLKNKKKAIIIAHNLTDDNESDYTIIPFGCISKIIPIDIGDKGGCRSKN